MERPIEGKRIVTVPSYRGKFGPLSSKEASRERRDIPLSFGRFSNVLSDHAVQRRNIVSDRGNLGRDRQATDRILRL